MLNRIKKNMPAGIMTVGFIISLALLIMSHLTGRGHFSYESFVLGEYMREAGVLIFIECLAAAIVFKIYLKKEKSSDPGSRQK